MLELAVFVGILAVLVYIWLTWQHGYWKKMNVPYLEPELFFGNVKDFILLRKCAGLVYDKLYKQSDAPVLGVFSMWQPQWLIRDPRMYKIISTSEFANFRDNDIYAEPSDFFFSTNVLFYSGDKWKKHRNIVTPALTMSKLKLFLPRMVEFTKEMISFVDQNEGKEFEARTFIQLFTMQTSMSYVYGLKCNTYQDRDAPYVKVFMEIFEPTMWNGFKFAFANLFPTLGHFFKIGITPKNFVSQYLEIVKSAVDFKKQSDGTIKDFLQFLIDASGKNDVPELSVHDMLGLTMNVAGDATETVSSASSVIIDALIRYPQYQTKLREEITLKIKSLADITYENINDIHYLEAFIYESFRILPPVPVLLKKCTSSCDIDYNGKTYSFKKGDKLAYPILSIHKDPEFFPDPDNFDPERFLQSGADQVGFTPFGSGPRMCLGRKLAHIMMKVYLCSLLINYEVLPVGDKAPPLDFEAGSLFFLMVKGGVRFKLNRITT